MLAYMATSKKTVAKATKSTKASTKKVTTTARKTQAVIGSKVLKTGKVGAGKTFESAKAAAAKVAPESNPKTVVANIYRCISGVRPTAYGYKWSK